MCNDAKKEATVSMFVVLRTPSIFTLLNVYNAKDPLHVSHYCSK